MRLVKAGDAAGAGQLYAMLHDGIRFFLARFAGSACAEDIDSVFLFVFQAIRRGDLRDPEALIPFALAAVKDYASVLRENRTPRQQDAAPSPASHSTATMSRVLREMAPCDREVLIRYYVRNQTPAQIRRDMDLSPAQFQATRIRARVRFAELDGENLIPRKPVGRITRVRAAVALP
jgi:DNA-directed RNA polymerase specialized sigma24 family protein